MLPETSEKSRKDDGEKEKSPNDAEPSTVTTSESPLGSPLGISQMPFGDQYMSGALSEMFASSSPQGNQRKAQRAALKNRNLQAVAFSAQSAASPLSGAAVSSMADATAMLKSRSNEEARLKREHLAAYRDGADVTYELMEAHAAAVEKARELARCESQVKRGTKGMLKFELMEATQLCTEAREALGPAEELYRSIVSEEAGVRQSLASAESTSQQVASLEQRLAEDARLQQEHWVQGASRELLLQRQEHRELKKQHYHMQMEIAGALDAKKQAGHELHIAKTKEAQAFEDAELATAERMRFQEEMRTEERAAERSRNDLRSAQSHSADVAASQNVLTCMIDALEADAEDAGKMAVAEVFEAQQMNQLLHSEVSTFDQLEGECERIRREIRDLSRLNRSKLLEL